MRCDQLEHTIRASCQIVGQLEVIVVGSQAILGAYPEYELPSAATRSLEVDILPITDDNNETMQLADLIFGAAGDLSQFQQTHDFSIDGVDLSTSALAEGWRTRLVKVQNENTAPPGGHPQCIGWCLDKEDLCVAKLCAFREKDRNFVDALISDGLVDVSVIAARLPTVPRRYSSTFDRATAWLAYRSRPDNDDTCK